MKKFSLLPALAATAVCLFICNASAQTTNWLPGRVLIKLLPDYIHARVLALNQANGSVPGTVLALDPNNGTILGEISVNLNPTDMATSPAGDVLYVINAGSQTISKLDLNAFTVVSEKPISTPRRYNNLTPLYLIAGPAGKIYYTDGAWGPEIYLCDFNAGTSTLVLDTGGNGDYGAGGMVMNRSGDTIYIWRQYGWSAGMANSTIASLTVGADSLTMTATGPSQSRDPLNTPIFLDAAEKWVFNKMQKVAATNVTVLLAQFTENIYAISLDGTIALGDRSIFNAQNGTNLTNFSYSSTVQTVSPDQRRLFRYRTDVSELYGYDLAGLVNISGPAPQPIPADGSVVALSPTNLNWTPAPMAVTYRAYFGTNQAQVAGAGTNSSLYLGAVTSPGIALTQKLQPGTTYYWRLDVVGFVGTNTNGVWSFTVLPVAVIPPEIQVEAVAAFNPAPGTLSLTSSIPRSWTAGIRGANWASLGTNSGTTPSTLLLTLNTRGLVPGVYSNVIDITAGGMTASIPVTLNIQPLIITQMLTDYQRPYIYALQPPPLTGQTGRLLFINTTTEQVELALPVSSDARDMSINYEEGRLYVIDWLSGFLRVVDLNTKTPLPPIPVQEGLDRVNAGRAGRIIMEDWNQWVYVRLINTTNNGEVLFTEMLREGDGEMSPDGRFYYHCDNNSSAAGVTKFAVTNDTLVQVGGGVNGHPYGSRHLLLSPDGTRLFWRGYMYDTQLSGPQTSYMAELAYLGDEVYATTIHGELAFSSTSVFNTRNGQSLYTLPVGSTVLALSGDQQKVFLYDSAGHTLRVIPMSQIAPVPTAGLVGTPADNSVIGLPLTQLGWTISPFALEYRVYFGTNASAVGAANTNSTLFAGATTGTSLTVPGSLQYGQTYFWRVDSIGLNGAVTGAVWRFTTAPLAVTPQSLAVNGVVGLPILSETLNISAPSPTAWSVVAEQPWLNVSTNAGVTPSSLSVFFNTAGLPAGIYTNDLIFSAGAFTWQVPVTVELFNLEATLMLTDRDRPYIYVLHHGSSDYDNGFLLFLNTDSGVVEKVLAIGPNPTDMSINRGENRLYVVNWLSGFLRVVDLNTKTLLPSIPVQAGLDRVNAARPGRIIMEDWNQWIYAYILDTMNNGAILGSAFFREGDGECDPTGHFYYHVDNNSSGAAITKYNIGNDSFVSINSAGPHYYYGSRHLVMSLDGNRLFWTSAAYDANLVDLGVLGTEIYACSTNGSVAFGDHQAIETATRQVIYTLPVSSTVMAVDRLNQRLWYFNSTTKKIESLAMSVIRAPSITKQPATNTAVPLGGNVNLSVTAMGLNPLFYQWMLSGTSLIGETNYFLALNNIQLSQQGNYQVVVSNPYGAVTSTLAQVTVLVAPTVVQHPIGTNIYAGQSFSLSIAATGTSPLAYQWSFENVNVAGATNATLIVSNAQAANEGIYRAMVQNAAGWATSSVALVRVVPAGPSIISGPISIVVPAASNVAFSVTTVGSQPMVYQWFFNGGAIQMATASQYSVANAQAWNIGNYYVVVANAYGSVTSAVANLGVTPVIPYFVQQPAGAVLPGGTNWTLTGIARGSDPISYSWQHDGVPIVGAYQSSLTLSNLKLTDTGNYALVAFNTSGSSTSLMASVIVTAAPPVFVQQPVSTSVLAGSTATFSSLAAGSIPLQYQWYFQSSAMASQTNRQLMLNPATTAVAGTYFVVASNQFGSITSAVVQLTVNQPPVLQQALSNVVVSAGSTITLTAVASGNSPLAYSWQFNGTPMAESNSTMVLTNTQPVQSGFYRVTISNPYGSVSSTGRVSIFGTPGLGVAWGDNSGGQTNVPNGLVDAVVIAGGDYHSLALRRNGTLVAWGYNGDGQASVPTSTLRFVSIAAGATHNLAIREDGSLVAWGRNDAGQTGMPPTAANNVLAIAAGDAHSLALLGSRTVVAWGDNSFRQTTVPPGLNGVCAIAAGRQHSLALRTNGVIVGWGFNAFGQATPSSGLSNVIAIAAGYLHSAALCSNGKVVTWGDDSFGQTDVPAGLSNVIAIAAGDFHMLALRADGEVIGWGDDYYQEIDVPSTITNVFSIAAGNYHGLALIPFNTVLQVQATLGTSLLQWQGGGVLQWAPTPSGPFTDVSCQGNSYTNTDISAPAKFFRLKL